MHGPRVQRLATGWTTEESDFPSGAKVFLFFSTVSPQALGPTQPPLDLILKENRPGRELTTRLCLMPSRGALVPLPHTPS
jgi:hypothetical protein